MQLPSHAHDLSIACGRQNGRAQKEDLHSLQSTFSSSIFPPSATRKTDDKMRSRPMAHLPITQETRVRVPSLSRISDLSPDVLGCER